MDSDDEIEEPRFQGVPATIILVNMFDCLKFNTAQIAQAAICGVIRQLLRDSSSQCIGISLFGVDDSDNSSMLNIKSVFDLFPLRAPTLEDFKKLKDFNISNVKPAKELIMSDVLLHCSRMFANCKKLLSSRTIIILSRLEDPPVQTDIKPALKRVEDLVDSDVYVRIINISEAEYNIHTFFEDFLLEANKGRDIILPKPIWNPKDIEKLLYQQSHRHLAVSKLKFDIGNGMNIGVGIYSLLQSSTRQKTSDLDRDTNTVLSKVTKTLKVFNDESQMDVDDGVEMQKQIPLLKSETIHYQEYGGKRIEFLDSEMNILKNPFGPPMLKLLGFKPANFISKEKWYLKKGYFLFPNESIIEGSTTAFKAMHTACIETGMMAICILCTRINSRPINVALSPCSNPLGLDIDIGFDVICLPFVEHVRDLEVDDIDEEIDFGDAHHRALTDIIESMKFKYKPEMFENPKQQSQYRAIEAIALEESDLEPFIDTTKPPKQCKVKDSLFYELFGNLIAAEKRSAPANDRANAKQAKYDSIDETLLQERIANEQVSKYTVSELKTILKSKQTNLPALTGFKKAELIKLLCKLYKE